MAVIRADAKKSLSRREVAAKAECTVGRVGEVVRWLDGHGTKAEQGLVAHLVAKDKAAAKSSPAPKGKPVTKKPAVKSPRRQAAARGVITEMEDALAADGIASPLK